MVEWPSGAKRKKVSEILPNDRDSSNELSEPNLEYKLISGKETMKAASTNQVTRPPRRVKAWSMGRKIETALFVIVTNDRSRKSTTHSKAGVVESLTLVR